jgi:hypothetical protein
LLRARQQLRGASSGQQCGPQQKVSLTTPDPPSEPWLNTTVRPGYSRVVFHGCAGPSQTKCVLQVSTTNGPESAGFPSFCKAERLLSTACETCSVGALWSLRAE